MLGGIALLAGAIGVALADRGQRLSASNHVPSPQIVAELLEGEIMCQQERLIPPETGSFRLLVRGGGPSSAVHVEVRRLGRTIASGSQVVDREGLLVLPLTPAIGSQTDAKVCFHVTGPSRVWFYGTPTGYPGQASVNGRTISALVRIDFLLTGERSWWSLASKVAQRWSAGHSSALQPWTAILVVSLLVLCVVLGVVFVARAGDSAGRGSRPWRREGGVLALIALLMAVFWACLSPPFHATDEIAHFAYVQAVAELGRPPRSDKPRPVGASRELLCVVRALRTEYVRFRPTERPPWFQAERADVPPCGSRSRKRDEAQYVAFQPPLYYFYAAGAYQVGRELPLLDRLLLARLATAILAAVTVLLVVLFVRELFPGSPWPARAAGLAVAFQPVFMFNASGVNSDALLNVFTALALLILARAFRRGFTTRRAVLLGAAVGAAFLSKLNFVGLLPGVLCALALLIVRRDNIARSTKFRRAILVLALGAAAFGLYAFASEVLWDRQLSSPRETLTKSGNLREHLIYIWQFYLPRLPFMYDHFSFYPATQIWFEGFTTRFGWWDDFGLADGFVWAAALVALAVAALAVRGLRRSGVLRTRRLELLAYTSFVIPYLLFMALTGLRYKVTFGQILEEGRYLFPLLALYGAVIGAALHGAGRQRQALVTAILLVIFIAHTVISVGAMIGRYYV